MITIKPNTLLRNIKHHSGNNILLKHFTSTYKSFSINNKKEKPKYSENPFTKKENQQTITKIYEYNNGEVK